MLAHAILPPLRALAVPLLALSLMFVPQARASDEAAALATATTLVETAHDALTSTARPEAERLAGLQAAIDDAFAFDIWRRFLLDDAAADMTDAQRAELEDLLPGFLAALYRDQFARGLDRAPEVGAVRGVRRDLLVAVKFQRANGGNLPTEWRIRDFGDRGHLVIDVIVGGVSFLQLKRDEFRQILAQRGPDGLIDHVRENALATG
ncbi:MAG: ABC transporter substrate-binding protein [Pseudomonadota bacterium]